MRSISVRYGPPPYDLAQRPGVDVMELVPALPCRVHQTRRLQHLQVLRDGLPGRGEPVLDRQPGADLEQGLAVALDQLVEDRPPGGIRERLEHVTHRATLGK